MPGLIVAVEFPLGSRNHNWSDRRYSGAGSPASGSERHCGLGDRRGAEVRVATLLDAAVYIDDGRFDRGVPLAERAVDELESTKTPPATLTLAFPES